MTKLKIAALFVLTGIVIVGLCSVPSETLSLQAWAAVMFITKGAAFAAAYMMKKIIMSLQR